MGFVKEQHEEWKARQEAGELDPNEVIARESGQEPGGEAPAAEQQQQPADEQQQSNAPEGYEAQPAPQ